jgi:hypothetical protein
MQHGGQGVSRARVASLVGPTVGRLGAGVVAALVQQHAEVERGERVAALIGPPVGRLGTGAIVTVLEQHPEVERTVGVAELVGPAIEGLGGLEISALGQHAAEMERGLGMTERVGPAVGALRAGAVALLLECGGQRERGCCGRSVRSRSRHRGPDGRRRHRRGYGGSVRDHGPLGGRRGGGGGCRLVSVSGRRSEPAPRDERKRRHRSDESGQPPKRGTGDPRTGQREPR